MSWVCVDIETVPHDCVTDYVTAPDLGAVTPDGRYTDPVKKAESIATKQAALTAEYQESLSRASLDWNLSRIVAIGLHWLDCGVEASVSHVCHSEDDERRALWSFWDVARNRKIVGFAARTFDVPTLIQRSRLLNVSHPKVRIDRYGRGDVIDVRDVLTFDDARYEALMPRSLKMFCKRFGLTCTDEIDGKDIAELVKAGEWEKVESHVRSDVAMTVQLAKRVGAIPSQDWNHQKEEAEPVL